MYWGRGVKPSIFYMRPGVSRAIRIVCLFDKNVFYILDLYSIYYAVSYSLPLRTFQSMSLKQPMPRNNFDKMGSKNCF